MTGGVAVILGSIGANFGAGMTGGMAFLYDPEGQAEALINPETLVSCGVGHSHWESVLKDLIERHHQETGSAKAEMILANWASERRNFVQICPTEMLAHLSHPLSDAQQAVPAE